MDPSDQTLCDLILELIKLTPKYQPSEKALEISEKMPSEHRQKLIDLAYMVIESTDTPVVWWAHLLELVVKEEDTKRPKMLREMIDQRISAGKWQ